MTQPNSEPDPHALVAGWLSSGIPAPEIERRLGERGIPPALAPQLVDAALAKQVADANNAQRRKDRVGLLCGAGLCVLGIVGIVLGIIEVDRFGIGPMVAGLTVTTLGAGLIIRTLL